MLRLILVALEDGSPLSRKVLVLFVVQRLTGKYPQVSDYEHSNNTECVHLWSIEKVRTTLTFKLACKQG